MGEVGSEQRQDERIEAKCNIDFTKICHCVNSAATTLAVRRIDAASRLDFHIMRNMYVVTDTYGCVLCRSIIAIEGVP